MSATTVQQLAAVGTLKRQEPLARHTTLRIGGPAELFLTVRSAAALGRALALARSEGLRHTILGGGSNVLVSDAGLRGLVIENRARRIHWPDERPTSERQVVRVEAGVRLAHLARSAVHRGLGGLEWAVGIPGSVGGAVVCNAGAHGASLADVFVAAAAVSASGEAVRLAPEDLAFAYRTSALKHAGPLHDATITHVELELRRDDRARLTERTTEYERYRRATQPTEASAGCIFRNPQGFAAGWLIEQVGLKGQRQGGARISPRHANFIVNLGGATAADVLRLVDMARERVLRAFGVELELEVVIADGGGV